MIASNFYKLCSIAAKQASETQKVADSLRVESPIDVKLLDDAVWNLHQWIVNTMKLVNPPSSKGEEK